MSTRDDVLSALRDSGDAGVSGQVVADGLGISRVAVSKHVAALRRAGYEIDAHAGHGYRLIASPALPIPTEVAPLLHDPFWARVEGAEVTGSTNDDARTLAEKGAPEGTVVIAARQTAGRGRFGRTWESPAGGMYASVVLRPQCALSELAPVPLVIAVGVADGLASLGAQPQLKWPNDVLLGGRKVAGVLLEMSGQPDHAEWLVAGIGVNIASEGSVVPEDAGAFTAQLGEVRPAEVAAVILDSIAAAYRQWVVSGFSAAANRFAELDALAGSELAVRDLTGAVVATGVAAGIDDAGRLLLRAASGGVQRIASGEVTLRS